MKIVKAVAAFAAVTTAAVLGQDQDIVDIVLETDGVSTLRELLVAADLVDTLRGDGPFTVLAPVNAAFDKLPAVTVEGLKASYSKDELTNVLTHHVAAASKRSTDFTPNEQVTMVNAETVTVNIPNFTSSGGSVADVTEGGANIIASNGIIHLIDSVLVPDSLAPNSVLDLATPENLGINGQASFDLPTSILGYLVGLAGLTDTLNAVTEAGFTVLAPTDQAFLEAVDALNTTFEALAADVPFINRVLLYHVIPVYADAEFVTGLIGSTAPTALGETIDVIAKGDGFTLNNANVDVADVKALNGIVHVIDTVLVPPPEKDSSASASSANVLIAALAAFALAVLA